MGSRYWTLYVDDVEIDAGRLVGGEEAAVHAVDAAIQTHGGNGLTLEYGIVDLGWPVRGLEIGPVGPDPTSEEPSVGGGGGWATANGSPFLFS